MHIFKGLSVALVSGAMYIGSAHGQNCTTSSSGFLINTPGLAELPTAGDAAAAAQLAGLNQTNIQSDVLVGMRKHKELFFFFGIQPSSVATFKSKLASDIYPLITNTMQLLDCSTVPTTAVNVAFSHSGLTTLGVSGITEETFANGQAHDASNLGDPGTRNWVPGFIDTENLHGVFLIASDTIDNVNAELAKIQSILNDTIVEIHRLQAEARPGNEEGHEHFGFLDGISQPAVEGFTENPNPGQVTVPSNVILVDNTAFPDAEWANEGSFLAFRQLKQLVPEFNKFLADNPIRIADLNETEGSDLLGARMVGRWKSGTPVDLAPLRDNITIGNNSQLNNNFNFSDATDQSRCPFSAHVRKTNPRSDLSNAAVDPHRIIRAGTPYGPEVTPEETASDSTSIERGLAFVAYQSNITNGFHFVQQSWANNPDFIFGKPTPPGFDPIIGANASNPRNVSGLDPTVPTSENFTLVTDFIESRGGEYFFSPSLSAILNTLSV